MTLHSNQSSFPASDLRGAAIVAAPCNIQSQSKGEINDLSASRCAGGWFTNTRHRSGGENSASSCEAMLQRGSNHTHAASSPPRLYFLLCGRNVESEKILRAGLPCAINQRWADCGSVSVVCRLLSLLPDHDVKSSATQRNPAQHWQIFSATLICCYSKYPEQIFYRHFILIHIFYTFTHFIYFLSFNIKIHWLFKKKKTHNICQFQYMPPYSHYYYLNG